MGKLGWAALGVLGVLVVLQVAEEATANEINQTHSEPYIHGDNVNSIQSWMNSIKAWETEQKMKDNDFNINKALAEFFNGSNGSTEQEELLQLQSSESGQSIGWRYDRRDDRPGIRPLQEGESESSGS